MIGHGENTDREDCEEGETKAAEAEDDGHERVCDDDEVSLFNNEHIP